MQNRTCRRPHGAQFCRVTSLDSRRLVGDGSVRRLLRGRPLVWIGRVGHELHRVCIAAAGIAGAGGRVVLPRVVAHLLLRLLLLLSVAPVPRLYLGGLLLLHVVVVAPLLLLLLLLHHAVIAGPGRVPIVLGRDSPVVKHYPQIKNPCFVTCVNSALCS
jgi:hypothetical protein